MLWGLLELLLIDDDHVHLCAHKMSCTHTFGLYVLLRNMCVSFCSNCACVLVTLFAETLIINMLVTDDVEALLPSV